MSDNDNKEQHTCMSCDGDITAPGVGHAADCRALRDGVECLRYTPPPYIIDKEGRYFLNLAGGSMEMRRI